MSFDFKPEPWMDFSACKGMPTEIFFPKRGRSSAEAIRICGRCPVKSECWEYAERTNSNFGVWGGVDRSDTPTVKNPTKEEPVLPLTFSASAMQTYLECPSRYFAEYIERGRGPSGEAASLGTVCHKALEDFVAEGWYKAGLSKADEQGKLMMLYRKAYWENFSEANRYEEGLRLIYAWLKRQDWSGRTVISTEQKLTFDLVTSAGVIPFTYIMDRLDLLDNGTPEVTDYKSLSRPIPVNKLKDKLQARVYALAAMIMYPKSEGVWVTFDMLRHEPIGVYFTKQDCRDTWNFLIALAERILADEEHAEVLGEGCRFCVRKFECDSLKAHEKVGGILGVVDVPVMVKRKHDIDAALVGLKALSEELDKALIAHLKQTDTYELDIDDLHVSSTISGRRFVPPERVCAVIGDELFRQYGAETITMARFDDLVKDPALTSDQKSQLQQLVGKNYGDAHIKIERKVTV